MIHDTRVERLNDAPQGREGYVLYWMQQSQRADQNHALEYAIRRADTLGLPVLVGFGLTADYPDANVRHYRFMLEGLRETAAALRDRGIGMVALPGEPDDVALRLAGDAALVVCDRGYLRHQKAWRRRVARDAACRVVQVETDVVVPVRAATDKREYAARTLRPKLHARLDRYIVELPQRRPAVAAPDGLGPRGLDLDDVDGVLDGLDLDGAVPPVQHRFRGGTGEAKRVLRRFLDEHLTDYADGRRHPETDHVSHMAMYLHFGQISPVHIAIEARERLRHGKNLDAFLEELIVRRELAHNFVEFTEDYDRYACLPGWARATLDEHRDDPRPRVYTKRELERAETHDPYWNAAMREMRYTGYMHNAMRMYWGKKILEWTNTPEYAFRVTLELNNRYFLDGRDPSSYANVGWIFGLHDRAWGERDIYGKVRTMTAGGLERKCDIDAYVAKVDRLVDEARRHGVRFEGDG